MSGLPSGGISRLATTVVAAALAAAGLAGGSGPAAAAAGPGEARAPHAGAAGVISTVAGGVGGPRQATKVAIIPQGVAFGAGRLYITDFSVLRAVDPGTGRLTTPAGNGAAGPLGEGGRATQASPYGLAGVTMDRSGNVVFSDATQSRVVVVAATTGTFYGRQMTAGHIYTVAGDGTQGYSGDGGPATSAKLAYPYGVVVDAAGNVVISDMSDFRIRVVAASTGTFYGQHMTAGDIYTIAGDGTRGGSGDGGPATSAALNDPSGVTLDSAGNVVIADTGNNRVRVVAATSGTFYGQAMTAGDIYTIAGDGTQGFSGDGGPATSAALNDPSGITLDSAGNVVIADTGNARVRVVAATSGTFYGQAMTAGDIYTIAGTGHHGSRGDGGPAASAELSAPVGVALDGSGNLAIADRGSDRVRLVAGGTGTFYGQGMTVGDIYTVAGNGWPQYSGDGGAPTQAQLNAPRGLTVDAEGNLVIADTNNNRVRVAARATGTFYGQQMKARHIYTAAGDGDQGFSGDGGPATRAELDHPGSVAVDADGNLVIADTYQNRIQVVADSTGTFYGQAMTAGDIYLVAGDGHQGFSGDGGPATKAALDQPYGVAVDPAGNLVIADTFSNRIQVVAVHTGTYYGQAMTAGDIYTVAGVGTGGGLGDGGPATSAELGEPWDVAVDGAGNLVIADTYDFRIRVVAETTGTFYGQAMTAGDIYTVAGDGDQGFSGDNGPATKAELKLPEGVAVDAGGNVVIADTVGSRIRVVAVRAGTFYGKAMTAGDIYAVAGAGRHGLGNGGPATRATLASPEGVAADGANLLIADANDNRIQQVTG